MYTLRIFQSAGPSTDHREVATYENLSQAPVVPQIGSHFRLRDPNRPEAAGRVLEVVTVVYGTFTVIEIYLSREAGKKAERSDDELELLKLAAYFQKDYAQKLPVIGAFRRWRNGLLTDAEFLARLREDDVGPALGYEDVPPMHGLALFNDYIDEKK